MEPDRVNSPQTSAMVLEVLGHQLHFSQDPNSKHLGTTVWDASMVFVKFLEKNCRKGRFCPSKLKGKRVVELGAGCGVAGFGMALLGCDVISTDQNEVLPLLRRNVECNSSRIQMNSGLDLFGSVQVAELNWGNDDNMKALHPPYDYIIGTDVVYAEHLLEPLLQTIFGLSGPKTTILLGYEIRSSAVHEQLLDMCKKNFEVKIVPKAKMDIKYQHPSIQLFIMGMKPLAQSARSVVKEVDGSCKECVVREAKQRKDEEDGSCSAENNKPCDFGSNGNVEGEKTITILSDWDARRYGSMAARLLRDVKIA